MVAKSLRKGAARAALIVALLAIAQPAASAESDSTARQAVAISRVRSHSSLIAAAIRDATERSQTFRGLVETGDRVRAEVRRAGRSPSMP